MSDQAGAADSLGLSDLQAAVLPRLPSSLTSICGLTRRRRKKCDEALPTCGDCARLGLTCLRPSHNPSQNTMRSTSPSTRCSVSSAGSSSSSSSSSAVARYYLPLPTLQASPFVLYDGSSTQELHLLQHYTHAVARALSVVPDEINAFISLFVPMALQQPALRHALLGLSATHLKRARSGSASASASTSEFEVAAVEHQACALALASRLLHLGTHDAAMEGLAAVLFLCLQEVCEGRSRKWPIHLQAAVTIINERGGPAAYPDSVRFLIESMFAPPYPPQSVRLG